MSSIETITTFIDGWVKSQQLKEQRPPKRLRNDGPYQYFTPRPVWLETALSLDNELPPKILDEASIAHVVTTLFMMLFYLMPKDLKDRCSPAVLRAEATSVAELLERELKSRSHDCTRVLAFATIALNWDTSLARKCPHLARIARKVVGSELLFSTQYACAVIMDRVRSYPNVMDRSGLLARSVFGHLVDGTCECSLANFRHSQEDHPQQRAREDRCGKLHSFGGYCTSLTEAEEVFSLRDFLRTAVVGGRAQLFHEEGKELLFQLNGLQEGILFSLLQRQTGTPTLHYVWLLRGPLAVYEDCDGFLRDYVLVNKNSGSVTAASYYRCLGIKPRSGCKMCFVPRNSPSLEKKDCPTANCGGRISSKSSTGYKSTGITSPRSTA